MNKEVIKKIRSLMNEMGIDGYLIKNSDYHNSEYIGDFYKVIKYIIGFGGSMGEFLITDKNLVFWTDSRYDAQIKEKLHGEDIEIITLGKEGCLNKEEWIKKNVKPNGVIAFDGRTYNSLEGEKLEDTLLSKGYRLKYDLDIVSEFWEKRPDVIGEKAFLLGVEFAGKDVEAKLKEIREVMKGERCETLIVQSLSEIAWILNIRGKDIKNNPFITGNLIIEMDKVFLYVDSKKISKEIRKFFISHNIFIEEYDEFYDAIKEINKEQQILIDSNKINFKLKKYLLENKNITLKNKENVISLFTSIKNSVEIENIKKSYLKDGVALVKFIYWLKNEIKNRKISEQEAADKMDSLRGEQENFFEPSFDTISAYMANAAMPHYSYKDSEETFLEEKGIYLVDSGGQYLEGTTDVTRMIVLGELDEEIKKDYTLVLKGMIALSKAKFLHGTTGTHLDYLSRSEMWRYGINFNHGTGHGIGYFSGVHEGPYGISPRFNSYPLIPGVVITNEPGIYIEGSHGIRIENTLLVKKYLENSFGKFYEFENLTITPIDIRGINFSLLTEEEKSWLKNYHTWVYEKLSPFLNEEIKGWLKEELEY